MGAAYPYVGRDQSCRFNPSKAVAHTAGECYLHCWLSNLRCCPCRLQLPALLSGVFSDPSCRYGQLNHAVLLVGYNKSGSQHYWIVKNSWGSGWGTSGYIHMKMGENSCGIANMAMYPLC